MDSKTYRAYLALEIACACLETAPTEYESIVDQVTDAMASVWSILLPEERNQLDNRELKDIPGYPGKKEKVR